VLSVISYIVFGSNFYTASTISLLGHFTLVKSCNLQAYFAFDVAENVADYNNEQLDEACDT